MTKHAFVVSGSSDIGAALIEHWLDQGWSVRATYRRASETVERLRNRGAEFFPLDLNDPIATSNFAGLLRANGKHWDVFMTCPSTMEPIAPFISCDFQEWERSVSLNFSRQMQILHAALPHRRHQTDMPLVLLWAGPGSNNAPPNYSAEIVAKICQIKMCELLDAEIPDCRFVIIGPGWVATKTHLETLAAGAKAGTNFERTKAKLASNDCTPMGRIIEFVDWVMGQPKNVVSGRNFSVVHDIWGEARLAEKLALTPDAFKLRRFLNDWNGDR